MNHIPDDDWPDEHPGRGAHHGHRGRDRGGFAPGAGAGFGFAGFPFPPGFGPGGPGRARHNRRGRRGEVRESILALLAEEPANGYQLMQALAERTQGLWRPSPGAVYPALNQLEDEGLIEAFDNDGQKAFRLTEAGRTAAEAIETTPWEARAAAAGGAHPEAMHALWQQFAGLAGAAKEVARNGSATQLEAAAQTLADARRSLYGLLASDGDIPNADDLR